RKCLAVHARQLALEPSLQILRRSRRPLLQRLEQAGRSALAHHVHWTAPMGARVLIKGNWYKPGQIAIGTNGAGTLPHFAGLVLEKKANVPITVVPYNQGGTMAAVADVMGGRVHGTIEGVFGLRGPLQSGDLKLIGQMAPQREPEYPSVPTVSETNP